MNGQITRRPNPFPEPTVDAATDPEEIPAHERMINTSERTRSRRGVLQRIDGYWTPLLVCMDKAVNPYTPGLG